MAKQEQQVKKRSASSPFSVQALQQSFADLRSQPDQFYPLLLLVGLVLLLIWAYFSTLRWTYGFWTDPLYSHGYLVPAFTLVLLWMRRERFASVTPWARWCGLALLGSGLGTWMLATHYAMVTIEAYSFVPSLAGVFLLVGGWRLIRWAGPAILFLMFMFPLPSILKVNILDWLQRRVATPSSTYALQTLGITAYHEGNRISIGEMTLGVVDACSGLRMATIFLALAVAIVLVTRRPWWDQLLILISAIPIALTVNVVRITVTGILYMLSGNSELAHRVFHEWAGWFMMPLALGLLYIELQVLAALVIEEDTSKLVKVGATGPPAGVVGSPRRRGKPGR